MPKKIRSLALGLTITGSRAYWAMALVTLVSVKKNLDISPSRILIATDQNDRFAWFSQLGAAFGCKFVHVVPRQLYKVLLPKMKGNFATYWKFDLFNSLTEDEVLMYIDVDAFAVGELNVSNIIDLLGEGRYHLAAVPSPRPVLERMAATRISNPFDYFNAGVLFGVRDNRYSSNSLSAAFAEIMKFDTLKLFWHDQDIFNYLFRSDTFKLPYCYNVHTGFLLDNFRASYLLNYLASDDIDQNAMVVHVSGDFLLNYRYHPHKSNFAHHIDHSVKLLSSMGLLENPEWSGIYSALAVLRRQAIHVTKDYFLQCVGLRKRVFASHFYYHRLKSKTRAMKMLFRNKIKILFKAGAQP